MNKTSQHWSARNIGPVRRANTADQYRTPQETYQKEIMAIVTIKTNIYRPVLTECIIRFHALEEPLDEGWRALFGNKWYDVSAWPRKGRWHDVPPGLETILLSSKSEKFSL